MFDLVVKDEVSDDEANLGEEDPIGSENYLCLNLLSHYIYLKLGMGDPWAGHVKLRLFVDLIENEDIPDIDANLGSEDPIGSENFKLLLYKELPKFRNWWCLSWTRQTMSYTWLYSVGWQFNSGWKFWAGWSNWF